MSSAAQKQANRANAKLSTGPKTPEGKAASSRNGLKLGLAARTFAVLPYEDQDAFDNYTRELSAELKPVNTLEWTLVAKMAQHHWMSQRAFVAQDICFETYGPRIADPENQRQLAVYLRYQTTHDRQFHKCLQQLQRIQADRRKAETEQAKAAVTKAAEQRKAELHAVRLQIATLKRDREQRRTTAAPATSRNVAEATATTVPIAA